MVRSIFLHMIGHHNASKIYKANAIYMAFSLTTQWKYKWNQNWTEEMHSNWKTIACDSLDGLIFMAENPIYEECYGWLVK